MNSTLQGYLLLTMLSGALLALVATWLLLRRYRKRVVAIGLIAVIAMPR